MNEQIEDAVRRVRAYWFVDGFIEMAAGALFVLLGVLMLLGGLISPAALSSRFLTVTAEVAAAKVVGIVAALLILWWLKDHFTYPRTGFVRTRQVTPAQVAVLIRNSMLFLLLPILGLLVLALLLTSSSSMLNTMPAWFPMGVAVVWAVLLFLFGEWTGVHRFRVLAAVILAAGIVVGGWQMAAGLPSIAPDHSPGLPAPEVEIISRTLGNLASLVSVCGATLLLSGILTFLHYRKENPVPYGEGA